MTEITKISDKCLDATYKAAYKAYKGLRAGHHWHKLDRLCETHQILIRPPLEDEGCLDPKPILQDLKPPVSSFSIAEIYNEHARRFRVKDEMAKQYRKDLVLVP